MTDPLGGLVRMNPALAALLGVNPPVQNNNPTDGPSFKDVLLNSIEQVNQLDRQSQSSIASGLVGNDLTQAEIFTNVKKADLAFRTMMQIRNKLMDAYNEVKQMRM